LPVDRPAGPHREATFLYRLFVSFDCINWTEFGGPDRTYRFLGRYGVEFRIAAATSN